MTTTTAQQVLEIVRGKGIIRARDLAAHANSPTHLQRLYEQGLLQRSGRGVYLPAEAAIDDHTSLTEVALRVPAGIICLLSALQFYDLTTQSPHQVWIALPLRANKPHLDYPPIHVIRLSGEALTAGIDTHQAGSIIVHVCPPRLWRTALNFEIRLALRSLWKPCETAGSSAAQQWMNSGDQRSAVSPMSCVPILKASPHERCRKRAGKASGRAGSQCLAPAKTSQLRKSEGRRCLTYPHALYQ